MHKYSNYPSTHRINRLNLVDEAFMNLMRFETSRPPEYEEWGEPEGKLTAEFIHLIGIEMLSLSAGHQIDLHKIRKCAEAAVIMLGAAVDKVELIPELKSNSKPAGARDRGREEPANAVAQSQHV